MKDDRYSAQLEAIKETLGPCEELWAFLGRCLHDEADAYFAVTKDHEYHQGRLHGFMTLVKSLCNIAGKTIEAPLRIYPDE